MYTDLISHDRRVPGHDQRVRMDFHESISHVHFEQHSTDLIIPIELIVQFMSLPHKPGLPVITQVALLMISHENRLYLYPMLVGYPPHDLTRDHLVVELSPYQKG